MNLNYGGTHVKKKKMRRVVSKHAIGIFKKYSRHSDVSIIKYYSFYN